MTHLKLIGAAVAVLMAAAPAVAAVNAPAAIKPEAAKPFAADIKMPGKADLLIKSRPAKGKPMPRTIAAGDIAVDTSVSVVDGERKLVHSVISNGPVADTPRNRALYGGPMSRGGEMTAPVGN